MHDGGRRWWRRRRRFREKMEAKGFCCSGRSRLLVMSGSRAEKFCVGCSFVDGRKRGLRRLVKDDQRSRFCLGVL